MSSATVFAGLSPAGALAILHRERDTRLGARTIRALEARIAQPMPRVAPAPAHP